MTDALLSDEPGSPSPTNDQLALETSSEDVTAQVRAHLQSVQGLYGGKRHRVREKSVNSRDRVMSWVAGSKESTDEVGDDWFGPPEKRGGMVRLSISKGKDRIGRYVGGTKKSGLDEDGKQTGKRRKGKGPAPLVVVAEEQEGHSSNDLGPSTSTPTPFSPSPVYSDLSLVESPTGSMASFDASELSRTNTVTTIDEPATPAQLSTSQLPQLFSALSTSSYASGMAEDRLGAPPSRTLTLDESRSPKSTSRRATDAHSNFSKKGPRFGHKSFQKVLQSRIRKITRGETQLDSDELLEAALIEEGVMTDEKEQYAYDVLYEHQRGLIVFGVPKFSSAALTQFDPAPWTDSRLRNSPFTPDDHPLPDPSWTWDHPFWFVDMSADVDECGWSYALRFRSTHWRGEADGWRSFARRRRWIRGRVFKPSRIPTKEIDNSNQVDWDALKNSEFDEKETPSDGPAVDADEIVEPLPKRSMGFVGLKAATALLPLSHEMKNDIFGWEGSLDPRDPFLAYSFVKAEGDRYLAQRQSSHPPETRSEEQVGIWKSAVVEINYRRMARVLKLCRLDREKVALWRWWLGLRTTVEGATKDESQLHEVLLGSDHKAEGKVDTSKWADNDKCPAADDVWDLLEGRLDQVLQLFEFQISRLYLLHLILSLHPVSHLHHHWSGYDRDEPFEPAALSPKLLSSRLARQVDFYRDVQELEQYYSGLAEGRVTMAVTPDLEERDGWKGKSKKDVPNGTQ